MKEYCGFISEVGSELYWIVYVVYISDENHSIHFFLNQTLNPPLSCNPVQY